MNKLYCYNCKKIPRPGANFCNRCGAKLIDKLCCASCGAELSEFDKFCSNCGVAVDVESALMHIDFKHNTEDVIFIGNRTEAEHIAPIDPDSHKGD